VIPSIIFCFDVSIRISAHEFSFLGGVLDDRNCKKETAGYRFNEETNGTIIFVSLDI